MARTNYSFCLVAFFFGVTLLCNGPSVDATRIAAKRILLQQPRWCVAKVDIGEDRLQGAIDYYCNQPNVDCNPIKPGGVCFIPDTKLVHASYAINLFMHATGVCPDDVGRIIDYDVSHDDCTYISS